MPLKRPPKTRLVPIRKQLVVGRCAQNQCLELQQLAEVLQRLHVRQERIVTVPQPITERSSRQIPGFETTLLCILRRVFSGGGVSLLWCYPAACASLSAGRHLIPTPKPSRHEWSRPKGYGPASPVLQSAQPWQAHTTWSRHPCSPDMYTCMLKAGAVCVLHTLF